MDREYIATIKVRDTDGCSLNDLVRKYLQKAKTAYYNTMNGDIYANIAGTYRKLITIWKYGNEYTVYATGQIMA